MWDRGAGDVAKAIDALMRARAAVGGGPLARELGERLHTLAGERDAWDELGDQVIRAGERAESAAASVALLHEGAALRVAHGRAAEAEHLYRRLLGLRPDDNQARAGLELLYRTASRWSELAAIYEERVDPRLGTAVPEAERPPLLAELARIYDAELARPYEAIDALERLVALAPADAEAHERLGAMYEKVGRWARAVNTLGKVAELEGGRRGAARRAGAWRGLRGRAGAPGPRARGARRDLMIGCARCISAA